MSTNIKPGTMIRLKRKMMFYEYRRLTKADSNPFRIEKGEIFVVLSLKHKYSTGSIIAYCNGHMFLVSSSFVKYSDSYELYIDHEGNEF